MEQFFNDFERKLIAVEEKLNILSEWHFAKGHEGAADIAEECMMTINKLWFEFDKLSKIYKQQEAAHEDFFNAHVENLLGELKKHDEFDSELYSRKGASTPDWLLFNYLNKAVRSFTDPQKLATDDKSNIWYYLRSLIIEDLTERGVLE